MANAGHEQVVSRREICWHMLKEVCFSLFALLASLSAFLSGLSHLFPQLRHPSKLFPGLTGSISFQLLLLPNVQIGTDRQKQIALSSQLRKDWCLFIHYWNLRNPQEKCTPSGLRLDLTGTMITKWFKRTRYKSELRLFVRIPFCKDHG